MVTRHWTKVKTFFPFDVYTTTTPGPGNHFLFLFFFLEEKGVYHTDAIQLVVLRRRKRRSLLSVGKRKEEVKNTKIQNKKEQERKSKIKSTSFFFPFYFVDDKFTLLSRTGRQFCIVHSTQLVTSFDCRQKTTTTKILFFCFVFLPLLLSPEFASNWIAFT